MLVTLSGIVILVSEAQPENALSPMVVAPVIITVFRLVGTSILLFKPKIYPK